MSHCLALCLYNQLVLESLRLESKLLEEKTKPSRGGFQGINSGSWLGQQVFGVTESYHKNPLTFHPFPLKSTLLNGPHQSQLLQSLSPAVIGMSGVSRLCRGGGHGYFKPSWNANGCLGCRSRSRRVITLKRSNQ